MPQRKLAANVPSALADAFEEAMRAKGHPSTASALRALIKEAAGVGQESESSSRRQRPGAAGLTQRLWVHVSAEEAEEFRLLAQPFGGVAPWLRGIVEAKKGQLQELPAREEIEALNAASVQLARLATNFNQTTRALNTARLAGEPIDAETVRLEELAALRLQLREVSDRVNGVIFAARRRVCHV